jgi:signal transduction histidine kinase
MTHEFKTPIATIKLALDAINNDKIKNDLQKREKYLKMIREENERMNSQVENVLRISQLERKENIIKKSFCDIHEIIEKAISHLDLILKERKVNVSMDLSAINSKLELSKENFFNVFVNILENAIKYSDINPKITIQSLDLEGFLLIQINDNGMGMNSNIKDKIFEKFYRETKGDVHNVKGHGLGLSYVKKILDLHNGIIYVDSEVGVGSTFSISLPIKS